MKRLGLFLHKCPYSHPVAVQVLQSQIQLKHLQALALSLFVFWISVFCSEVFAALSEKLTEATCASFSLRGLRFFTVSHCCCSMAFFRWAFTLAAHSVPRSGSFLHVPFSLFPEVQSWNPVDIMFIPAVHSLAHIFRLTWLILCPRVSRGMTFSSGVTNSWSW